MEDLQDIICQKTVLEIIVEAVNNTVSLDSCIFILLVFGAYLHIYNMNSAVQTMIQRATAIPKFME